MSKFQSGRQSNLNLGISSFTESNTVLQTVGKVGIGTTNAQSYSLFVVGSANITGTTASQQFSGDVSAGVATITTGNITNVTGSTLNYTGLSTITDIRASGIDVSGIVTARNGLQVLSGGINVTGVSTFQNNVDLGDNDKINLGDGNDLQIYHNSSDNNGYIVESNPTGSLLIQATNLYLQNQTGTTLAAFNSSSSVDLYYNASKKFETTGNGVTVFGTTETQQLVVSGVSTFQGNVYLGDNDSLYFGDGNDLQILHNGTYSLVGDFGAGNLILAGNASIDLMNPGASEYYARFNNNGAVELYYDNSKKFETTGVGVTVFGTTETQQLVVSGVSTFQGNVNLNNVFLGDNDSLYFGNNNNLRIFSGGNNVFIQETGESGSLFIDSTNLVLRNTAGNETLARFFTDGAVELYYDNIKKFETTGIGVTIAGTTETQQLVVSGVSTFQGNVDLGDNDRLRLGNIQDLQIYHNGSNSVIQDVGAGSLILGGSNSVEIRNAALTENTAKFITDGAVELYYDNSKKFETTGAGVTVFGTTETQQLVVSGVSTFQNNVYLGDNDRIYFGDDIDSSIYHDGNNLFLLEGSGTGNLYIKGSSLNLQAPNNENYLVAYQNGAVELYYDNSKKFETTGVGVTVFGTTETQQLVVSGVSTFQNNVYLGDNDVLNFGAGNDLRIYHNGNNSIIEDTGDGALLLRTNGNLVRIQSSDLDDIANFNKDGSVELYYDNSKKFETTGAGVTVFGTTETQQLVVSGVSTFQNNVYLGDNDKLSFGPNQEFDIYWTGGASILSGNSIQLRDATSTENYLKAFANGAVELYYDNNKKFETTGVGVTVFGTTETQQLVVSGVSTFQGDAFFGDNDVLNFGAGNDLRIYHAGTDSYIDDAGSGNLNIRADNQTIIRNADGSKFRARFGSQVELYYENSKKFETTSTGASVTGIATATTFYGQGGTFNAGIDNVTDAAIIVQEEGSIYTKDGEYLRNLIQKKSDVIIIGQQNTSFIDAIELKPGAIGSTVKLHAGGTGDNVKLQTASDGIQVAGIVTAISGIVTYYGDGRYLDLTDSVALGGDTTGDYVESIAGTNNQITVTGGTGEGSTPILSIPNQFTIPQDATVARDLVVQRDLYVDGSVTIGGTSASIFAQTLQVSDSDLILGIRTDGSGNDVSNDTTANHGGIAIASTEGNPLVDLYVAGIETVPTTYKKIMWFKAGTFSGLGTDAWLSNYAVGIGSTQFPTGTRFAAGSVQFTENDLAVVRNINASGIVTAPRFVSNVSTGTAPFTVSSTTVVNNLNADTVDGLEASQFLRSDANDTASGVITFSNGNTIYGTSTALSAEFGVNTSAAGAIKLHGGTNGAYGLIQATTSNLHIDTVVGGTYLNYYDGSFISFGTGANSESARFTGSTGTLTIGAISETGTTSQRLQVTGGAYVSGNLGIGRTNPSVLLHLTGGSAIGAIVERNSSGESHIRYQNTSGTMHSGISTSATFWGISDNANLTEEAHFVVSRTSGNVGINSTAPTEKLDVVGTVKATDFNTTSDQNLKTNIQTIENPLEKIVQIRGVNFEWKENNKPSAGVIAQEVEKVLPQLVNGENTKTVNYNGLIGLLVEAVKAQQDEINELKKET